MRAIEGARQLGQITNNRKFQVCLIAKTALNVLDDLETLYLYFLYIYKFASVFCAGSCRSLEGAIVSSHKGAEVGVQ